MSSIDDASLSIFFDSKIDFHFKTTERDGKSTESIKKGTDNRNDDISLSFSFLTKKNVFFESSLEFFDTMEGLSERISIMLTN